MSTASYLSMKVERKMKVEIPHRMDLSEKLADAKKIIEYIYKNNVRSNRPKAIPDELRICSLSDASISGILWYVGRTNRPREMPEPFFVVYGSCAGFYPEDEKTICINEGKMWIPAPPGIPKDAILRWIHITKSHLLYYMKVTVDLPMPVYEDSDDEPENKPFNINQLPNLGIENTDGNTTTTTHSPFSIPEYKLANSDFGQNLL
jgi:hypothetical protein